MSCIVQWRRHIYLAAPLVTALGADTLNPLAIAAAAPRAALIDRVRDTRAAMGLDEEAFSDAGDLAEDAIDDKSAGSFNVRGMVEVPLKLC